MDQIYSSSGAHDSRTAVLAKLIEHTSKLLARIQAADIVSQEKRLKKQNLPGGVRHLAQANLKDVVSLTDRQVKRPVFVVLNICTLL